MTRWLAPLSTANLVANIVIVVTGGAVRLTDSGLGCPTWPQCTEDSYRNSPALGIHGIVEFGNRTLTFGLGVIIVAIIVVAWQLRRTRPVLLWLAAIGLLGIVAQAGLGGITVLTGLNPWTVAGHFLVSMALIYAAYLLWHRVRESDQPREFLVPTAVIWLARLVVVVTGIVLIAGTIVTGSGPHSGDTAAQRTGFDPETVSQLHADGLFILIGLTIGLLCTLRATEAPKTLLRAGWLLIAAELTQGIIGFTQYFTGLPVLLVASHMLGACLVWLAAIRVLFCIRIRSVASISRRESHRASAAS
jgi:heme a synthase